MIGEEIQRCRIALARLRPGDRELILRAISGTRDARALAERVGKISGAAARVALTRALARLRDEMNALESNSMRVHRRGGNTQRR